MLFGAEIAAKILIFDKIKLRCTTEKRIEVTAIAQPNRSTGAQLGHPKKIYCLIGRDLGQSGKRVTWLGLLPSVFFFLAEKFVLIK